MTNAPNACPIKALADRLMRAVVSTGAVTQAKIDPALEIMRTELKAFLVGDDYRDARDCVARGSLSDGTVFSLLVANTVAKILKA